MVFRSQQSLHCSEVSGGRKPGLLWSSSLSWLLLSSAGIGLITAVCSSVFSSDSTYHRSFHNKSTEPVLNPAELNLDHIFRQSSRTKTSLNTSFEKRNKQKTHTHQPTCRRSSLTWVFMQKNVEFLKKFHWWWWLFLWLCTTTTPPKKTAVFGRPRPTWNSVCMRVYKLSECPVKWLAFVSLTQVLF